LKVNSNYIKTIVDNVKNFEKSILWFKQKVELKSKYLAKKSATQIAEAKAIEEKPKRKPRTPKTEK
jgi:hypothetical protein